MNGRQTQKADYWGSGFAIEDADLDYLYNLLLEEETPLTTEEMAHVIIRRRISHCCRPSAACCRWRGKATERATTSVHTVASPLQGRPSALFQRE